MWLGGPVRKIGLSYWPARLGIDSWAPQMVYKYGLCSSSPLFHRKCPAVWEKSNFRHADAYICIYTVFQLLAISENDDSDFWEMSWRIREHARLVVMAPCYTAWSGELTKFSKYLSTYTVQWNSTNLSFKPANIWEDWLVKKNCHFNDFIAFFQLNIVSDAYDRGFGGGGRRFAGIWRAYFIEANVCKILH